MGIDWWPCKLDEGVERADLEEKVRLNHRLFLLKEESPKWTPYLEEAVDEKDRLDKEIQNAESIHDLLVFKFASHRVSVIGENLAFPVEWRLDAYRTIPPWELPEMVQKWKSHFQQVQSGKHRAYLFEWFLYTTSLELRAGYTKLIEFAHSTEKEDAQWTQSAKLHEVREEIKALTVPERNSHPVWEDWRSRSEMPPNLDDERYVKLLADFNRLEEIMKRWNRFGRRKMQRLSTYLPFEWETYEQLHATSKWPAEFFDWVEPYVQRRFGLYRDC